MPSLPSLRMLRRPSHLVRTWPRAMVASLSVAAAGCTNGLLARTTPAPAVATPAAPAVQPPQPPVVALPLLSAEAEPAAAASDSAGVARLVRLSFVWHIASLHHPAAAVRGVPLDSAFIRAVTLVRAATDAALLETAYTRFVATLADPLTRIERGEPAPMSTPSMPAMVGVERTGDGLLVLQLPTATHYAQGAEVALRAALATVPDKVVLDMRAATPGADVDSVEAFVARMQLVERLASFAFTRSSVRVRRVGGAREVQGRWQFDDAWLMHDGALVTPLNAAPRRVMVLANANSVLPRSVLGLVAAGTATLVAEGAISDAALVPSVRIAIGNDLYMRVRTGELVHADGSSGLVADTVVALAASAADSAPALRTAVSLLRTGRRVRASRLPYVRGPAQLPGYYDADPYPFMGARVLAGARVWSAMRARHAHRDLYDDDADAAFAQLLPRLESARAASEYARALRGFVSLFDDAAVRLTGASMDSVTGVASAPFRVRWVEGRALITDVLRDSSTRALGIEPGVEVVAADGFPLPAWVQEHRRDVSAPNEWTRMHLLMQQLPRGAEGGVLLRLRDMAGRERQLTVARQAATVPLLATVERPSQSSAVQLPNGLAYLDFNRLTEQTANEELARHRSARAWILDLRGALADSSTVASQLLRAVRMRETAVIARELHRYQSSPCLAETLRDAAQQCTDERELRARVSRSDTTGHYAGRLIALIDERTQGAMERLALALEATTDVTFIGSSTAGSPSEAVAIPLSGGLTLHVPAAELRRADGAQWQRVGIAPLVEARLTVRAMRNGTDDVLERAQQWLVQQLDGAPRRRR